ncbi:MAG: 2Fe-2S iron-sulfur cluster-binding protein [Pseudomonadota bacterium]
MTRHRVTLLNRAKTVLEVGEEETIYDAALAAGIQLPIACAYGGCITCAARKLSGKVVQPKGTALNRRQSQAGYILLCVARPRSDVTIEVGVESHGDLYQNPFAKPPAPRARR